ncbi:MAG: diguanylate cyclase [Coleofasciculaceae cyanobacterium SM2_1_6]|nr:diguanylate cyclase [Coleofasciculaceae cyanobacterium SM2_1_6]
MSVQIDEKESATLINRLQQFLKKSSVQPIELTNQDALCRAGAENRTEINILYPDQADFAAQLQKLEANNRRNSPLIQKVQGNPGFSCTSPRNEQANFLPPDPAQRSPHSSPRPDPPLQRGEQGQRPSLGARIQTRGKAFYVNGEPVQIDTKALQNIRPFPKPENRETSKALLLPIRNAQGEPVAIMQLLSPSPFSDTTESISKAFFLLGMGLLLFSVILYFVLDRFVLSRISRLEQQIGQVKGDLQNPGHIKLEGRDELANLAKSINKMLQRQINFQKQLQQAKHQIEITNRQLATANQELEHLAKTDGLTQVMNRHFFQLHLEEVWQEALQNRLPVSLILCDVDFFKLYNDTYGHLAGDLCLQKVAKAMREAASMEPKAIVARYGGEEFVVILPYVQIDRATQVAENMRSTVSHLKLPHSASKVANHVTLSIGVATLIPQANLAARELIAQADQHLYHAKASGRNQVVAELVASYSQA